MKSVILVTNIPTPYRLPLFNELNRQLAERKVGFQVLFAAQGYGRRKWAIDMADCHFSHRVLQPPSPKDAAKMKPTFTYPGLGKALSDGHPDVVIAGGFTLGTIKIWFWCRRHRVPFIIWSGAVPQREKNASWLRRLQRKVITRGAAGGIVYGTRAREYLCSLGLPENRVHIGINTVDTEYFRLESARWRNQQSSATDAPRRILYVGDLIDGKRVDLVIDAIAGLAKIRQDFVLQLVGAGAAESQLKEQAERLGVGSLVRFEGYRQKPDVARYLGEAACFVFPSAIDVWGLVLVEAMSAGLPCLSSIRSGVTIDTIEDGKNGFALDFEDIPRVAERLAWILDHPAEASAMGARAQETIRDSVNLRRSAEGFVAACDQACGKQR